MSRRRQERMAEEIKRLLSQIILTLRDPRINLSSVSITRVDITNDLSYARVNVSILGDNEEQEEMIKVIQKAKGFMRSELSRQLDIRYAPELEFFLDKSIEHGIKISSILAEIKEEEGSSNND
ncbi:MAG TPA: 30S ribosome-binding factor RbfA [Syntrophomonadaceae bacterium]|nr:30S ribosome-binding factor RbfA [Syntrophomonadaceae bacterium]